MVEEPAAATGGQAGDYVTLAKPRLNLLVVATTLAGYYMAAPRGLGWALLLHTLVGTALVASGASAFNQLLEIESDGLMRRTRARPLPSGRIEPGRARAFALVLSILGLAQLAFAVNLLAAAVALVTLLTYTVFYTPLKKRTSLATVVGGIPGALPPMIGWAAVCNNLSLEAWILFGVVFLWQMPHFLAIAWMYREDYKRAGVPLLPIVEPDGGRHDRERVPGGRGRDGNRLPGIGDSLCVVPVRRRRAAALLRVDSVPASVVDPDGRQSGDVMNVSDLPALNASLNGVATVFLAAGYLFIRRRQIRAHRASMLAAVAASALFLMSYVIYHANAGSRPFTGTGPVRAVYFLILITHIVLAAAIVPMVLMTLTRALRARFDRHAAIARRTLPLWLYVSVTGVVIYLMLYRV